MSTTDNTTLSKTISFLRLPLIIGVVLIHIDFSGLVFNGNPAMGEGQFTGYRILRQLVSNEFARIAVPLFFFISGFLFFFRTDFTRDAYVRKLKKRISSMLIPYIVWNIIILLITLVIQTYFSSILSGQSKLIADYNRHDWINIFWAMDSGGPICGQLWFMRDLMAVSILSPLIYYFVKYCKIYGVAALGALWLTDTWVSVPGFSIAAIFFFTLGAWFSINRHDFTSVFYSKRRLVTSIYLTIVAFDLWLWHGNITQTDYVHRAGILFGMTAVVCWTAYGVTKDKLPVSAVLAGSSFFIFAYHGVPTVSLAKIFMKTCSPDSEWLLVLGYVAIPVIVVCVGISIYMLIRKYFPTLCVLLTGGR